MYILIMIEIVLITIEDTSYSNKGHVFFNSYINNTSDQQ